MMIPRIKEALHTFFPSFYKKLYVVKTEVYNQFCERRQVPFPCSHYSLFRYLFNYFFFGVTPEEYHFLRFDTLNVRGKNSFITMRRNRNLNRFFNSTDSCKVLWDKAAFNEHFAPYINRKWILVDKNTPDEAINKFFCSLPNKSFIIKPNELYYGIGVSSGNSVEEIYNARANGEKLLVEEKLVNCSELATLNNSSLNTFRIVTCIDRTNHVNILTIVLRSGREGSIIDNLLGGGICYHLDIENGIVDSPGRDRSGREFVVHPTSQLLMPGFKVPRFEELKQYSIELAMHLPQARFVGWDIAITPEGLEVIEGNVCPSAELIQCNGKGLYEKACSLF